MKQEKNGRDFRDNSCRHDNAMVVIKLADFFADFQAKMFCSKSAEMKILLCKVGMGIKLYETKIVDL